VDGQGNYAEAEREHRSILEIRERVLRPEHPETLTSRSNLAYALEEEGRHAEGVAENRRLLGIQLRGLGSEHPHTLGTRKHLAAWLFAQGNYAEAEEQLSAPAGRTGTRPRVRRRGDPQDAATPYLFLGQTREAEQIYRGRWREGCVATQPDLGADRPEGF